MTDDTERRKRLEEIEGWVGEARESDRRQAEEHAGRMELGRLRARLIGLGLLDPEEPERAQGNWWTDSQTGEVRAWWLIDGCAYHEREGEVCVEREAHGRLEWTILDSGGEPIEPWRKEAPPGLNAHFN